MGEEKLMVGEKEVSLEKLSEHISKALMKVVKDTGKWEKFKLQLEFYGRREADEVHVASVVLRKPDEESETTKVKRKKDHDKEFMDELKKL